MEAACNDPAVDGLVICTPNFSHIDIVRVAAKSGKHILLEKPMATTIPDAYEIAQTAEGYSGVFQIGLQYRYKPIYVEAIHEALERRTIGDIKTITILGAPLPLPGQSQAVEQVLEVLRRHTGREVLPLLRPDEPVRGRGQ